MKRLTTLIILLGIAALTLAACGSSSDNVTISVDMKEFTFNPAEVTVPAGAEVTLELVNSGTLEHEWDIIQLGRKVEAPFDEADEEQVYWKKELQAGMEETLTFTAPSEPGEYELVCGTPGHLEAGMVGTLIVVEP